jgi:hypothetical protein
MELCQQHYTLRSKHVTQKLEGIHICTLNVVSGYLCQLNQPITGETQPKILSSQCGSSLSSVAVIKRQIEEARAKRRG